MTNQLEIVTPVPTENDIKRAIIQYLILKGCLVLRVNSGGAMGQYEDKQGQVKKRFLRFIQWFAGGVTFKEGQAGVSDILAIYQGRPIAIETKRHGNTTTEAQKRFLGTWAEHGGLWCVAESVNDVQQAFDDFNDWQ